MRGSMSFADCVRQQLGAKGFGKKKQDEILFRYEGLRNSLAASGIADAEQQAAARVFAELTEAQQFRYKATLDNLRKTAMQAERLKEGIGKQAMNKTLDGGSGVGSGIARAAVSLHDFDGRTPGINYATFSTNTAKQLFAIMGDVIEKIDKGAFGIQRGKAVLQNVVREAFGEDTGDAAAKSIAAAWKKTHEAGVDLFNMAGGSLRKLDRFVLPQAQNAARLFGKKAEWVKQHMDWLDWGAMRWPNGDVIPAAERERVLNTVYDTIASNGAVKFEPGAFGGMGSSVGNMLEHHRFLIYKDADSWLSMHNQYGDGSVFDVMVKHVEHMAHKTAMVRVYGRNPDVAASNIERMVRRMAYEEGGAEAQANADKILASRFKPMYDIISHKNPMDPSSSAGALVTGMQYILTAAQLGSAALAAIPGDFMTRWLVRITNKMGANPFSQVDTYLKAMTPLAAEEQKRIAAQSGFIMDNAIAGIYSSMRFGVAATYAAPLARRMADVVMRASLLTSHTDAIRWAAQSEFLGMFHANRGVAFDDLPFRDLLEKHGIGDVEWRTFTSAVVEWSPNPQSSVKFLRPIDLVGNDKLTATEANELFHKFQGMVLTESRSMVPDSTIEATAFLRASMPANTLPGALLHSFAMYKNFPVTLAMKYARMTMERQTVLGRMGFVGGLIASMTFVGALSTQLSQVAQGKDPLAMNTLSFWGSAFLKGGGLGIWGDFLFSGINDTDRDLFTQAAGPVLEAAGKAKQIVFGEPYAFANALDKGEQYEPTIGSRVVDFARQVTPGSNIWWARLALSRYVWDSLRMLADPKAERDFARRERRQVRVYGQESWWRPGDTSPARGPNLGAIKP